MGLSELLLDSNPPAPPPDEPHTLIVTDDEVEIEHPDGCPRVEYDGWWDYTCGTGFEASNSGLTTWFLSPADWREHEGGRWEDRPVLVPGRYLIEHWEERHYNYEYGWEYDAGLQLVYPEESSRTERGPR